MDAIFYGTKRIKAEPMTRLAYNEFRGWALPADEDGSDDGYLVEYTDGGKPNVIGRDGYVSWSPKEQFEAAYQASGSMSFGHALLAMEQGHKVSRSGWNGKGLWLMLVDDWAGALKRSDWSHLHGLKNDPFIAMKTASDTLVPWACSQTDMLAKDWGIVE